MDNPTMIPTELYDDEFVCFVADRYQTSPQEILQCFLALEGITSANGSTSARIFPLEDNEIAILRELTHSNRS